MSDGTGSPQLGSAELGRMLSSIRLMPASVDDGERIDRIRQFEELKPAIAAAQLLEASRFDTSQRAEQAVADAPASRHGRGVDAQLALALRTSPWHARRWLGWAKILTRELPATFTELQAGRTTEWRALIMARETVWLSAQDRAEVDTILAPQLQGLGDARVEAEAKKHAYRLDPAGATERRRVAFAQRRVTVRPRPDTMSSLTGTVSVEQGVAAWAALRREADTVLGRGEAGGRTRDQIMADTLVERLTGQTTATGVPIEVELILTADSLLGTDDDTDNDSDRHDGAEIGRSRPDAGPARSSDEPALLTTEGLTPIPIPAPVARDLIADAPRAWLRRLFTHPRAGELAAMDSRHRLFTDAQRRLIRYRDQYCSTPYCGAPIRHIDHARPAEHDGRTTLRNGNGKCVACNHAKQAPGWRQTPGRHGTITTPTGHRYDLSPPQPPGPGRPHEHSAVVDLFWNALRAA